MKKALPLILFFAIFFISTNVSAKVCSYQLSIDNKTDNIHFSINETNKKITGFSIGSATQSYSNDGVLATADGTIFSGETLYLGLKDEFDIAFQEVYNGGDCPSTLSYFSFGTSTFGGYLLANSNYNSSYFIKSNGSITKLSSSSQNSNSSTTSQNSNIDACGVNKNLYCGQSAVISSNSINKASNYNSASLKFQYFIENNKKKVEMTIMNGSNSGECRVEELHSEVGNVLDVDYFNTKYGMGIFRVQTFDKCSSAKISTCSVDDGKILVGENCSSSVNADDTTQTTPETEEEYIENYDRNFNSSKNQNKTKTVSKPQSCESLFGDPKDPDKKSPAFWMQYILDIMKYVGIAALVVLSSMDFFKAATQDDKDAIKKAFSTTVKRIIYCVLIFFTPTIVNLLMHLLGAYGTCGLK